jgi:glyoxylase-like metal-dependent hydrolase (beta-lactamase superfamily II)
VLVAGFPAGPPETNCWVLAPADGEECVVIDPGIGAERALDDVLERHRLKPVAVLLTHGHFDHTWAVMPVCGAKGVPAWIAPADREQLADPWTKVGIRPGTPLFGRLEWAEPDDVRLLTDGETLTLAGMDIRVDAAPGHTAGSVAFTTDRGGRLEFFSGDLLFAGSIGRTDFPGSSAQQIFESLARVCLPLPDDTVVRPGHGPETTIGRERISNPFLLELGAGSPPTRGL